MSQIVPLISSGTAGPLGVLHLPRLWQKVSLEAAGKIADGYPGIGAGYDSMVIDGLGLDAEAVRSFISGSKPTYPQFEAWVKEQPGVKLDADSVGALNDSITGYNHDDATRQGNSFRQRIGRWRPQGRHQLEQPGRLARVPRGRDRLIFQEYKLFRACGAGFLVEPASFFWSGLPQSVQSMAGLRFLA